MLCTVLLTRKMHFGILQSIKTIYFRFRRKKDRCYWQKLWLKQNLFCKQRFASSREYVTKLKVRMPLESCSCCCGERFSSCPVSQVLSSLQSGHRSGCLSGWLADCLPACVPFAGRLVFLVCHREVCGRLSIPASNVWKSAEGILSFFLHFLKKARNAEMMEKNGPMRGNILWPLLLHHAKFFIVYWQRSCLFSPLFW